MFLYGIHASYLHCVYCHSRVLVLLPVICGYGYKYRCGRQDTAQFPTDGRTVQQPAYNESICRHIPCPLMPGYPRSEKSGDDMGQDIRRFPFGIGAVFHELVDA